jgi:hypothetical protein
VKSYPPMLVSSGVLAPAGGAPPELAISYVLNSYEVLAQVRFKSARALGPAGTRRRSARRSHDHVSSYRERPRPPSGCATLPSEVRLRAQAVREAAQRLVKHSQELRETMPTF